MKPATDVSRATALNGVHVSVIGWLFIKLSLVVASAVALQDAYRQLKVSN